MNKEEKRLEEERLERLIGGKFEDLRFVVQQLTAMRQVSEERILHARRRAAVAEWLTNFLAKNGPTYERYVERALEIEIAYVARPYVTRAQGDDGAPPMISSYHSPPLHPLADVEWSFAFDLAKHLGFVSYTHPDLRQLGLATYDLATYETPMLLLPAMLLLPEAHPLHETKL